MTPWRTIFNTCMVRPSGGGEGGGFPKMNKVRHFQKAQQDGPSHVEETREDSRGTEHSKTSSVMPSCLV